MKHEWMVVAFGISVLVPTCAFGETGKATMRSTAEGAAVMGEATLRDTPEGLRISVEITHSPPGTHGIHVHEFGSCDDKANAAGGHYNPLGVPHGFLPTDGATGAHSGDMGNLEIDEYEHGTLEIILPGVALTGAQHSVAGRALILHEKPDDFGQPTGNAGARIGCGVIVISKE